LDAQKVSIYVDLKRLSGSLPSYDDGSIPSIRPNNNQWLSDGSR
jgi:hypothetical protein